MVGERGLTLSGGQRQRIALARALLTDPEVLLLDDATSSIDVRTEEEIHDTLRRVMEGRTTILVAHRRSTLNLADRIVVLDGGRVVDSGTHDELVERCRLYRQLLGGPEDDLDTLAAGDGEPGPALTVAAGGAGNGGGDRTPVAAGVTASAWQRPADGDAIALGQRQAYLASRQAAMGGPGAGGMAGGMGGAMAFARMGEPPTPELLAQIEALPPIVDDPEVDPAEASRPAPGLTFRRVLRPRTDGSSGPPSSSAPTRSPAWRAPTWSASASTRACAATTSAG